MADFTFNDSVDFETNLNAFLDHMEGEDAELGGLLRAHISKLKGSSDDLRRRSSRSAFNTVVKTDLDGKPEI